MNTKLLRKVKRHILAEPKRLYMSSYICTEKHRGIGRSYAKCGTAACIAGWACILGMKVKDTYEFWVNHAVGLEAGKLLNLDNDEQYRLFEPSVWPRQFQEGTTDDGKKATAKAAAARIEFFIKTKGTDKLRTKGRE